MRFEFREFTLKPCTVFFILCSCPKFKGMFRLSRVCWWNFWYASKIEELSLPVNCSFPEAKKREVVPAAVPLCQAKIPSRGIGGGWNPTCMSPASHTLVLGFIRLESAVCKSCALGPHPLRQVLLNKLNKDTALVWVFQEADPETSIAGKVFGLEDDPKKH